MQKVWDAGVWVLRAGFELADQVSWVDPSTITGRVEQRPDSPNPAAAVDAAAAGGQGLSLWSSLVALATLIALGLFFFQLISVALRGGRGMFRAFTGPLQFGMAIALTSGMVAILLGAADGMTTFFLSQLGGDGTFGATLANDTVAARIGDNPDLGSAEDNVRSMILGLAALFGVIPAGIGFALQMIFRQAAILVLVATIPLLAAMLVADSTASSFWRGLRWLLAAILMKPALALVLLIGVSVMARAHGVAGLLAGTAVLLVSLFCPMVIFRLLAFVDPGTGAGMALRSGGGSRGSSAPGSDGGTSESINVARMARSGSGADGGASAGGGGELGGSTAASPAAAGRAGGTGSAGSAGAGSAAPGSAGAAGGGSAAGGAAAGLGAVGGVAAAAVVGGYMATKAAAGAAGGYGSSQMAQIGVGHPGPAPAAGGGDIGSAAGGAYAGATATDGLSGQPASGDHGPIEPGDTSTSRGGPGPEPPVVDPGPPEAGRPDAGPSEPAPSTTPTTTAWAPEPARPAPQDGDR
ncbi:hypothetical protein [Pseudonocardia sp. HH130630-07]|uniref:hypothetical protein n=1 Tax=Pseudonocardia sp. HH130630-07 TaxID=1690815 RepID=UPI0008151DFB|nr:hypothetical protein [Pseudonocardia sp. HH130630-07]ANY10870.1 hypothetical protein AFB00_31260 [Pseudonocardia sp. HH130630-07]